MINRGGVGGGWPPWLGILGLIYVIRKIRQRRRGTVVPDETKSPSPRETSAN